MYNFRYQKKISKLKENQILSLAIAGLEEDTKLYDEYVEKFLVDYPETSKVFKKISHLKKKYRNKLSKLYKEKFGNILTVISPNDLANYYKKNNKWFFIKNDIETVRSEIVKLENVSSSFFYAAAQNSTEITTRDLLIDLANTSREFRDETNLILIKSKNSSIIQDEVVKEKRQFILTWVQPGLAGLMDGSVSTLAPIFATAFATKDSHTTLLVGLAASIGAGISMGFTEAVHDDGVLSGRGSPVKRGFASGIMTTLGGLGHALPYLISDFYIATIIAMFFVIVELWAIAWIQTKYMEIKFTKAVFQVVFGGSLVLAAGILIGGG